MLEFTDEESNAAIAEWLLPYCLNAVRQLQGKLPLCEFNCVADRRNGCLATKPLALFNLLCG